MLFSSVQRTPASRSDDEGLAKLALMLCATHGAILLTTSSLSNHSHNLHSLVRTNTLASLKDLITDSSSTTIQERQTAPWRLSMVAKSTERYVHLTLPVGNDTKSVQEIRVNWAYQSNSNNKEDTSNHFHIFVGDLSNEVNDEVLLQAFSAFGSVSEARVMWDMKTGRSRGYGFVAFRERGDAEKALSSMDGEWLGSRAIRCNWANQKGQPSISQQQAMSSMGMTPTTPYGHHHFPTHGLQSYEMVVQQTPQWQTTCYVGNLTPYTSQSDLIPLFQSFGYVQETRFQSDRGFAFVKMDTHENAASAICQLSGYNVNGRPLKCSVSYPDSISLRIINSVKQWGKDRPPTGQFEGYSPQQPQTPGGYPQASPAYGGFPQYGGPQAMTPQGGPPSAGSMSGYPAQSPMAGPSPGGRGYGGYGGGPGMPPQGYGQMQGGAGSMPGSAGGYGRNDQMPPNYGAPQSAGGYSAGGQGGGYPGFQG